FGEQVRIGRNIVQMFRPHIVAVVVAADADMFDACDLADMFDVVGDFRDGGLRQNVATANLLGDPTALVCIGDIRGVRANLIAHRAFHTGDLRVDKAGDESHHDDAAVVG